MFEFIGVTAFQEGSDSGAPCEQRHQGVIWRRWRARTAAKIAQLGERMTEDHKVRCSIHLLGAFSFLEQTPSFTLFLEELEAHQTQNVAVPNRAADRDDHEGHKRIVPTRYARKPQQRKQAGEEEVRATPGNTHQPQNQVVNDCHSSLQLSVVLLIQRIPRDCNIAEGKEGFRNHITRSEQQGEQTEGSGDRQQHEYLGVLHGSGDQQARQNNRGENGLLVNVVSQQEVEKRRDRRACT